MRKFLLIGAWALLSAATWAQSSTNTMNVLATVEPPVATRQGANDMVRLYAAVGTNKFSVVGQTLAKGTNMVSITATNMAAVATHFFATYSNDWGESAPSATVDLVPDFPGPPRIAIIVLSR